MNNECVIYKTVDFIGKRWTLLILLELYKGNLKSKRYSQIKEQLDITPKILSARLKELGKHKLISKKIDTSSIPIKCEYSLTKSGKDFIKIIKDIKQWALKWDIKNKICKGLDCKDCEI